MSRALIIAAKRSAVAPRGGAFNTLDVDALAAPVIAACLAQAGVDPGELDEILVGNGLYGGGNPARRIALYAGLPNELSATTIDRQCCSGLDAILLGARLIESGAAECVLAGGVESYSRRPIRSRRPFGAGAQPEPYDRPPFSPFPESDPDMEVAAADLAADLSIGIGRQVDWTVESHAKALDARDRGESNKEIVPLPGLGQDAYTRRLTGPLCRRTKMLAGDAATGILAATTAVEADGAAFVLLVSEKMAERMAPSDALIFTDGAMAGGDPLLPGLAPIATTTRLLQRTGLAIADIAVAEVMEAFAAQAIACVERLAIPASVVNRGGGALARGHPIGASGAILAVRLFYEMQREISGARGLATIAAAGGLATSALFQRV